MGGYSGVTETNMMIFLGIIEERVNYILNIYSSINAQVFFWNIAKIDV